MPNDDDDDDDGGGSLNYSGQKKKDSASLVGSVFIRLKVLLFAVRSNTKSQGAE